MGGDAQKRKVSPSVVDLSGRDDCLHGRILSTVHDEVAACDPAGAIRNEEPDDLCNIPRNAHPAQRNRGSHGLRGNAKRLRKVGADDIRSRRGDVPGSHRVHAHTMRRYSVASVLLHAFIAAFADEFGSFTKEVIGNRRY